MPRRYGTGLTAELPQVRVTPETREAVAALAKARRISAAELIREALDAHVVKSGRALTSEQEREVVAKAAPRVEKALEERDVIVAAVERLHERLDALEEARR